MKLVTKVLDPLNNFWVENYNDKAKEFFLNLGFKEVKYAGFKPSFKLEFTGSGAFGFWSDKEKEHIFGGLQFLSDEDIDIVEWDGGILEMNPYD